ncbi:MAG: cell envelope integrity protein TolA [Immundisolibacteraceae bacterium]|nr:cell envelope integrity protein TolA [Immundisolibacteraceae bacterium]
MQLANQEWRWPLLMSVAVHLILFGWLIVGINSQEKSEEFKKPAPGNPVVAEAINPEQAAQVLAQLDKIRADREAALKAEQQKVKRLQKEKARAEVNQKAAEKKKAAALRQLKKAQQQEKVRIAAQKEARDEKLRLDKLAAQKVKDQAKKLAEQQKLDQQKKLAEQKKQRKAEQEKIDQQRRAELAEAAELEEQQRQRELAEQERLRKIVAEQQRIARLAAEQEMQRKQALAEQMAVEQAQLDHDEVLQYVAAIQAKVASKWLQPMNWSAGVSCDVRVKLVPGGQVIDAQVVGSCSSAALNRSVEAAVVKASPLPVPDKLRLFNENFRTFVFVFRND